MSTPTPIPRKLTLAQISSFACNARQALAQGGIPDLEHAGWFRKHVTARCCACNACVSAEVMAAWLTGADLPAGRPAEELARLRQEYCLRPGCGARFYEFTFAQSSALDWAAIKTEAAAEVPPASDGRAVATALMRHGAKAARTHLTWRLAAVAGLLLALLVWRQWWTGGSIPFLREAKSFTSELGGTTQPGDDEATDSPPR